VRLEVRGERGFVLGTHVTVSAEEIRDQDRVAIT
jgi:hypothetical protein